MIIGQRLNKKMPNLDIVIITHTHVDHIKGLNSVIKKHSPVIYTIENYLEDLRTKSAAELDAIPINQQRDFVDVFNNWNL